MNTNIDLICSPHRCACRRHGGSEYPEGMTHQRDEKCPIDLPKMLRFAQAQNMSCCTMRGTLLAVVLTQFQAEHYLEQLRHHVSPKEADALASDLWGFEEHLREDLLTYLDEEETARPSVELRIPTTPDGHWKHSWHLPRVPVRSAFDILNEAAHWYNTAAKRGFGVIHEWRKA